jgi:hypothetical protein
MLTWEDLDGGAVVARAPVGRWGDEYRIVRYRHLFGAERLAAGRWRWVSGHAVDTIADAKALAQRNHDRRIGAA